MKKCIACGKIYLDDRQLFCEECGGPLVLAKDLSAIKIPESTDENNGNDQRGSRETSSKTDDTEAKAIGQTGNSNIKRNILIALSVCMMICALMLICHYYSFLSEKQEEKIVLDTGSGLSETKDVSSQPDISGRDNESEDTAGTGEMGDRNDNVANFNVGLSEEDIQVRKGLELYGDILDRYRYGIENGWKNTSDISKFIYEDTELRLSDVGFAVIDVNKDGRDELLVSITGEAETRGFIADVYSHDGDKPVRLMGSSDWCDLYLHEDGDIYASYDNAFGAGRTIYALDGAGIKDERSMILSYTDGEYFYDHDKYINSHGYKESGVETTSQKEYEKLLKEFDSRIKTYSVIELGKIQPTMTADENEKLFMTKYLHPLYAQALDEIFASNVLNMTEEELDELPGTSVYWAMGEPGYMLMDFDMDGVSELFVGLCGKRTSDTVFDHKGAGIDIYTIASGLESGDYLVERHKGRGDEKFYLLSGCTVMLTGTHEYSSFYNFKDRDQYSLSTSEQLLNYEYVPLTIYSDYKNEQIEAAAGMQSDASEVGSSPVSISDGYLNQVYAAYDAFFETGYHSVTEYTPDEWALVDLEGDGVPEILFKENSESMHGTFEVCYYDAQTGNVELAGTFYEEYYETVMYCAKKRLLVTDGSKASLRVWRGYSYGNHSIKGPFELRALTDHGSNPRMYDLDVTDENGQRDLGKYEAEELDLIWNDYFGEQVDVEFQHFITGSLWNLPEGPEVYGE